MRITDIVAIAGTFLWAIGMVFVASWIDSIRDEVPEDEGPDYDAGVHHVCFCCGCHLSGPSDGFEMKDVLCWDCYCATYVPDDDSPVPSHVRLTSKPQLTNR